MTKRLRLDAYVRVSQVRGRSGESFISPAAQAEAILRWADAHGHTIVQVHEELDMSGARADRPKLQEALQRIERGQSDGLAVAKLDRASRSLLDGLKIVERIEGAGGTFVSVNDGFDLTTDTGRLVLRIMLSLAEWELDRVRTGWNDAKARAVARGIHPSAQVPFGYRREQATKGHLLVHPENGPLVTDLFRRKAFEHATYGELARRLESQGIVTVNGNKGWSLRAIKDILRNRVYLGIAYAKDVENPDAHKPLTDRKTWELAQTNGTRTVPMSDDPSIVAPLLRCSGCRYVMRGERRRTHDQIVWRFSCKTGRSSARCPSPAAVTDDGALADYIARAFLEQLPRLVAEQEREAPELTGMRAEANDAEAAFNQWRDDSRLQGAIGMDHYLAGLTTRQDRLQRALDALQVAQQRLSLALPPGIGDLQVLWPHLAAKDHRRLLQAAIRTVFVRKALRRGEPFSPGRLHIVWNGDGQRLDLPQRGHRSFLPSPFVFPDTDN